MNVTLIGSGNLATNLGHALKDAGVGILQIYSRTDEHARRLADELGVAAYSSHIADINEESDIYIVAVKDDVLQEVMQDLFKHLPRQLIVHTAGSMPMISQRREMRSGVFYPMQTFSRQRIVPFAHIPIFIEASHEDDLQTLQALAERLSDSVYKLSSDDRRWLHVAAVFCCNFTNHMAALSARILSRHGIPFRVMLPLMEETVAKLHQLPPQEAQTGPACRGDEAVMQKHTSLLRKDGEKFLAQLYEQISKSIQNS